VREEARAAGVSAPLGGESEPVQEHVEGAHSGAASEPAEPGEASEPAESSQASEPDEPAASKPAESTHTEPGPRPGPERKGTSRRRRRAVRRGTNEDTEAAGQTTDDTDAGWGERRDEGAHDQWLLNQRPPHWD
jgi:hypothetical protein